MFFTTTATTTTYNRLGKAIRADKGADAVVRVVSDSDVNWSDDDPTAWYVTYADGTTATVQIHRGRPRA